MCNPLGSRKSRILFLLVWVAGAAAAQSSSDVTVNASVRSRFEVWDWFEGDANNGYSYSGHLIRLGFGQTGKRFDWQIDFAAPFLLGLPDDAVAPGNQGQLGLGGNYFLGNKRSTDAGMVFPKQAFLRWKQGAHTLRFGRFEYVDGTETTPSDPTLAWLKRERITQRLIGTFGWTHVGRSYDGAQYTWNRKGMNFTALGALPTRGVFQVDGWGNLDVALGYAALTRNHSGQNQSTDWRVFGIYYQDWRNVVKTDARPLAVRGSDLSDVRIGSFGGHVLHRAGPVDLMFWGVAQTGKWGVLDHRAAAVSVEAGWQPEGLPALKPWIRAGYHRGSGDDDPVDGTHGTFFQVLPTPRPYARFPFFNLMNNEDFMAMLVLRPHRAVTLRTEVHGLRLTNRNDLWYLGGGAFQPWSFGYIGRTTSGNRGLATLYDLSADYNVNQHWTFSGYFGHARGHSVMRSIYPQGKNANFGYVELMYRF
jgi:hypothetical protein